MGQDHPYPPKGYPFAVVMATDMVVGIVASTAIDKVVTELLLVPGFSLFLANTLIAMVLEIR